MNQRAFERRKKNSGNQMECKQVEPGDRAKINT